MPSTFFGLNIAYSGLVASNTSLNTTSNNISNVETPGYSKQTVVQQASEALRTFQKYGAAGAGVDTLAIERIRDEFYDVKYWNNNQNAGEYNVKQQNMATMETYFTDDDTIKGFNTLFSEFYSAMEEVANSSGDDDTKEEMIGYANNLMGYFNNLSTELQDMQKDINDEIKTDVNKVNALAQQISSMNKQINVIEMSGSTANELRDQRAELVDQLSQLVDVKVTETDITDTNNPGRDTGGTRFLVTIAGGQTLVDGTSYRTLSCTARDTTEKVNQSDAEGLYDIYWNDGSEFSLDNKAMGGELKGLAEMRDGNNGENFNSKVTSIGSMTDTNGVAHTTVTMDVTSDKDLIDLTKSTLPANGVITINGIDYHYDSWSLSHDSATGKSAYTFTLSDSTINATDVPASAVGTEAKVGESVDYEGIPYYMEQMNEWLRNFSQSFNTILTQTGSVDDNGNAATNMFLATKSDGTQYSFSDAVADLTQTYTISSTSDSYYKLTAANCSISSSIQKDAGLFATHTGSTEGNDKNDVVNDLINLKTDKSVMSFRGCSAESFLQCVLSDVSLNASSANTFYSTYSEMEKSIDNQRIAISGVDSDEEAVDLVKYQNAYNLASKMIQVFTEVYDRLILETGV